MSQQYDRFTDGDTSFNGFSDAELKTVIEEQRRRIKELEAEARRFDMRKSIAEDRAYIYGAKCGFNLGATGNDERLESMIKHRQHDIASAMQALNREEG